MAASDTIALGEKLSAHRRGAGYSQEELAEKLNVSRQAISKWERGEALPDTENLIALADLYGISLDRLLGREEKIEPADDTDNTGDAGNANEANAPADTNGTTVLNVSTAGRTITDEDDEDDEDNEDNDATDDDDGKTREGAQDSSSRAGRLGDALTGLSALVATVVFFLWGTLGDAWRIAWTVFLLIPVVDSTVASIRRKNIGEFCVPMLITFVYLMIGLTRGIWHPTWIMFIGIPIYYILVDVFGRKQ